jgi:hypothetical protein
VPFRQLGAEFLGAFRGMAKSACLFARMEQLRSHRMDFHEILYLRIFRKSVQKKHVSLNLRRIRGSLRETYVYL